MSELTGRIVGLAEVSKLLAHELGASLDEAASREKQIAHLEAILRRHFARGAPPDPAVRVATDYLVGSDGRLRVEALCAQLGVSLRQLERKFQMRVGLAPKQLARILRFQSVFKALENGDTRGGAALAADCGYYDQAHFIREFQRFAGRTPALLLQEDSPLTWHFTRARRQSHSYNTGAWPR